MEFRPIPEYEGYSVSECGKVIGRRGRIMKAQVSIHGYERVCLTLNSTTEKQVAVHRMVALLWVDGYREGLIVNHKDGNKRNNHASNLEWVTYTANNNHAIDTGLRRRIANNKLDEIQVLTIKSLSNMSAKELAKHYGVTEGTIHHIRRGLTWRHLD